MFFDQNTFFPCLCHHCGSAGALGRPTRQGWTDYLCHDCGSFRLADALRPSLAKPEPPARAGRFRTDPEGVRWLDRDPPEPRASWTG